VLTLALPVSVAFAAEGYAIDSELVRPSFGETSLPFVDTPETTRNGAVRAGGYVQYVRDPLVRYEFEEPAGSLVANRLSAALGTSYTVHDRVALRLGVPLVAQFGSDAALGGDGGGLGDIMIGAKAKIARAGPALVGARLDFFVPVGTTALYAGEPGIRGAPGLMADVDLGPVAVLADMGFMFRETMETPEALAVGPELAPAVAARFSPMAKLDAHLGLVARVPLGADTGGLASAPIEALAGVRYALLPEIDLDVDVGRGLTPGYGASAFRAIVGATWHRAPPEPVAVVDEPPPRMVDPDALLDTEGLAEPPPEPEEEVVVEQPLARVDQKEIVIRDPLQFAVGTDQILPESLPTLIFVAKLMNDNADIVALVIEGHASDEGDFGYNYDLSIRRTIAVYKSLVEAGVAPSRVSCRAFGEVMPLDASATPEAQAKNRRVMFHIARRLAPGEANPGWDTHVTLPWTGEKIMIPAAPPPAVAAPSAHPLDTPPPTRPRPTSDPETFDPREYERRDSDDDPADEPAPSPAPALPTEPPPAEPPSPPPEAPAPGSAPPEPTP
jgi:outer membrane protein OmpA-like peptidoglycan-associated protein